MFFFFKKTFNWLYRNINIYVSWSKMYWIGVKAQLRIPYFTVSPTQTRWSSIKPIKMDSFVLWISIFTQFWPITKRNLDWYIPLFSQVSFFNNNILIIRFFSTQWLWFYHCVNRGDFLKCFSVDMDVVPLFNYLDIWILFLFILQ